jgi:hypothetical protein
MLRTPGAALDYVLDQLAWSLDQPLRHGDRAWAVRVARALVRVAEAFEVHLDEIVRPSGGLRSVAAWDLLPFTAEERKGADLRQQLVRLREQLRYAATEFRGALGLFPPKGDRVTGADRTGELQDSRAFLLFRALDLCVRDLLSEVRAGLAAECSFLQEDMPFAAKHSAPSAGSPSSRSSQIR